MARRPQATVYVDGARELRRSLKKAGLDVRDDLKDAHRAAANHVLVRSRQIVPVAPLSMTSAVPGLLRDSLRPGATQTAAIVRAGKKRVPYAGPIHWGWKARKIKPSLYLTRAAKDTEPTWVQEYLAKFESIIDKIEGAQP
ncbi:hypothetical protein NLL32_00740 [Corynebacterium propinquum]|uniref:hypothetical protein n=1 Tax=Corynebacterium propinquum TaxID=43769 RepID=UPI002543330A|nr:hypothetical protein [Corynebacterium propinquum]MDK4252603.1 hypothetical protein [Corynebacterium propinquum]WKS49459.1 hypothetical protein NLL32_00740 [Corynebacterium propinquum]